MLGNGCAVKRLARVGTLHYVGEDFAGLGFHQFTAFSECRGAFKFESHGQRLVPIRLLGGPEKPFSIRSQKGGVIEGRRDRRESGASDAQMP